MGVRRVVTGNDGEGRSVVLADEVLPIVGMANAPLGTGIVKLWGTDGVPSVPASEIDSSYDPVFPSPPGIRYEVFHLMPDSVRATLPPLDPDDLAVDLDEKFPGLREHLPDGSGMHTTPTLDIGVVLSGEVTMILDDGAETLLQSGDTYVMNGTRHAWSNKTDAICVMAIVLLGADNRHPGER